MDNIDNKDDRKQIAKVPLEPSIILDPFTYVVKQILKNKALNVNDTDLVIKG